MEWTSISSLILFSDIVLLLLRDECLPVRQHTSKFVQNIVHKDYAPEIDPILSSLAEEQFIDWLNTRFRLLNLENPWNAWIRLIEIQLEKIAVEHKNDVDEVFDKSESNMFGETILVCKKMYRRLEQNLLESDKCMGDIEKVLSSLKVDWPELFKEKFFPL